MACACRRREGRTGALYRFEVCIGTVGRGRPAGREGPHEHAAVARGSILGGMDGFDLLQWPAMVVTVLAAWLVASSLKRRRLLGFWIFLLSNVLWVAWGVHAHAWALVFLQICLAAMNIRGAKKAEPA